MPGQYPERIFWELANGKFFPRLLGTGRAYAELKKQHMPGQYPERIFWELANGKFFPRLLGTGRAYAELKIGGFF